MAVTVADMRRPAARENRHEQVQHYRRGGNGVGPRGLHVVAFVDAERRPVQVQADHSHAVDRIDPPGAEARTSQGGTCRTPCTQEVSLAGGEITVSYALNGYLPASVTVRPGPPDATTALLDPNPVFAELRPATAPKPPPPKKKRRPKAPPAPAAVEAAPPPQTGFAPPPGAFTPVTPR